MDLHQRVADMKLLLEPIADVPAMYQTLLREESVVLLKDMGTLSEVGLGPGVAVLLIQQCCRHPELELRDLCAQGSLEKDAPSEVYIRYLLRALPAEVDGLQAMFETAVLGGNAVAAHVLADDP